MLLLLSLLTSRLPRILVSPSPYPSLDVVVIDGLAQTKGEYDAQYLRHAQAHADTDDELQIGVHQLYNPRITSLKTYKK